MGTSQRALGISLGAENIKAVVLELDGGRIQVRHVITREHRSNPRQVFDEIIRSVEPIDYGVLTGRSVHGSSDEWMITEACALEEALRFLRIEQGDPTRYTVAAGLGAEGFLAYALSPDGTIERVEAGSKCASGTGAFYRQQLGRMNITVEEATSLARSAQPHRVSGRCSVFCKSDCTHALNVGIPIGEITAGLCAMMAEKVADLLVHMDTSAVLLCGGLIRNSVIVDTLRSRLGSVTVPEHGEAFEALGAAYFALRRRRVWTSRGRGLPVRLHGSFDALPPLKNAVDRVRFRIAAPSTPSAGDTCIVGLDVGSTTTKATVVRGDDCAVLASVYLRTNGDPISASRRCYAALDEQLHSPVEIIGLGVTGSGRQIAGLHAGTDAVINEIIAHATGAAYYDPDVDTIFEIGGQDAKYTYFVNGVPVDYAMNEACSAGTGSFLEEAAGESLGLAYTEIESAALTALAPPNFNDQCAAFIGSDIKTAIHEGLGREEIAAGLVYSVCMNYVNRVRGQRPTGKNVFMQGGVCYNRAIPLAMATLIDRDIVVPPDPGMVGAFGVALEVRKRMARGEVKRGRFDLRELAARDVVYGAPFLCKGGKEHCDRKCRIARLQVGEKWYPFGGACNRYYNVVHNLQADSVGCDAVAERQLALRDRFSANLSTGAAPRVGLLRSYLTHTYLPLYSHFFSALGCSVVLSDRIDPEGMRRAQSSLCYPAEIAHGSMADLLDKAPDFIFMPTVLELPIENGPTPRREHQSTCQLLQAEPYYLRSAFKDRLSERQLLTPALDFSHGLAAPREAFVEIAAALGRSSAEGERAHRTAVERQHAFLQWLTHRGTELLTRLESSKSEGYVLFGRPYNAFAAEANMGIPAKFASRGKLIIPWDMLPFNDEPYNIDMCWAMGQNILRAAAFTAKHPRLFGVYITNFSCGPDSFLLSYFRDRMGLKPSLTLELDSHTADAGVNTRIDAFLDLAARSRPIHRPHRSDRRFRPAMILSDGRRPVFASRDGRRYPLTDRRVKLILPSMGRLTGEALAAVLRRAGMNADVLPVYDAEVLKLGRAHSSCKECLPLQLVTGGLLRYLQNRTNDEELYAYFMPTCGGNCRFTQYRVFLQKLIERKRLRNVALLSLTNEDGYAGLPPTVGLAIMRAVITADVMTDIRNALLVLAADRRYAEQTFEQSWRAVTDSLSQRGEQNLYAILRREALRLASIPRRMELADAKLVALVGEIFVRRDEFSSGELVERLARRNIVVRKAHVFEWLSYCDHNVRTGVYESRFTVRDRLEFSLRGFLQRRYERKIKSTLAKSGLYRHESVDIENIMRYGSAFFHPRFTGEAVLAAGGFFKDILHSIHGAISIGPFGCMPTRVTEAVMAVESTLSTKLRLDGGGDGYRHRYRGLKALPFLTIEQDGNPFPRLVDAKLDAFALQVERLHARLNADTAAEDERIAVLEPVRALPALDLSK